MRARLAIVVALVAGTGAVVAIGAGSEVGGFGFGVAAGELGPRSVLLWTRAGNAGPVTAEVALDESFNTVVARISATATPDHDLTVTAPVAGLRPATSYAYRFSQGSVTSPVGRFKTAPSRLANVAVRFAYSGDADATPAPGSSTPFFGYFGVYAQVAAERNDFNVNLGDTIYSDSHVPGAKLALTVAAKWAKYRQNLAVPALALLRRSTGLYSHWDDHEFVDDFSRAERGDDVYRAGVQAFTDYAPVTYSPERGLYRTFRWGRNVELFFLDERSFRSAKASFGGVCDGPNRRLDPAPTLPQAVRNRFVAVAPPLAVPAPAVCLERIRDAGRTMLGGDQLARFEADVARSTATFKVIVNEVPIQQFYAFPYDRWEGYEAERRTLLEFLEKNVKNVVFLTTDTHANLAGEVRLKTLEPGGPLGTGVLEVVTGPVGTNTFLREIDAVLGVSGAANLIASLFFTVPPPNGIGMKCAATNVFSYAEVEVTSRTLTITPKDAHGRAVRQALGRPCGPFTVRASAG